jgi:uncharacterized tellurite resistance protein B-like protein
MRALWARLIGAVADKHVSFAPPPGRAVILVDSGEVPSSGATPGKIASFVVHISYLDAEGHPSERTVSCIRLQTSGGKITHLHAHCKKRNAYRCFIIERIREVVDPLTGEVFEPVAFFGKLQRDGLPFVDETLRHLATILVFLAKCDGHQSRSEWTAIEDALARYIVRFGGEDSDHRSACEVAQRLAPTDRDFVKSLRFVSRSRGGPALARLAMASVTDVIEADGRLHEAEIEWVQPVKEILDAASHR